MAEVLEYFAPGLSSIEEVEAEHGPIWDATTLSKIADCPRKHQIRVEENLTKPGVFAPMVAGIAAHAGLEYYYSRSERNQATQDQAIEVLRQTWQGFDLDRSQMDAKYAHLTEDALAEIIEAYFHYWNHQVIEIFKPIAGLHLDDLNLSQVLAAKFCLTEAEEIILGESNLVMEFPVDDETLVLAGKPDLPVTKQDGSAWSMDHKTTSGYLSDWWAKVHEVSNKDRGYMAMLQSLLDTRIYGTVINGIYVGQHALNPNSKATKFTRYQFDFSPSQVQEALKNQHVLRKTIEFYRELDYWPQTCGFGGCAYPDLCRRDPMEREEVKRTDYVQSDREFWDL